MTDDLDRDLDAWLEVEVPTSSAGTDDEGETIVAPEDDELAGKLLFKVGRLGEDIVKVGRTAERRFAEITAWQDDRVAGARREIERATRSLEAFTRRWRRAHPTAKSKTIDMWSGKLSLREAPGGLTVTDKGAFIAWASRVRPDLLRYVPEPAAAKLKDGFLVRRHPAPQETVDGELRDVWRLLAAVTIDPSPVCPRCDAAGIEAKKEENIPLYPEKLPPTEPDGDPVVTALGYLCGTCGHRWDAETELVTIPGVTFTKPAQDRFEVKPTTKKETRDDDDER
jgi:phage host-nuclease inhibitor protein Gam